MTKGPLTRRRVRRLAALVVALAFVAAVTGCTDNANNAAKITYSLPGGSKSTTVSQSELLDVVQRSLDSAAFRDKLAGAHLVSSPDKSDSTTDATLTAFWLNFLIREAIAKSVLSHQHHRITATDLQNAQKDAPNQLTDAFSTLPKSLQSKLVAALAELTVARTVCASQRLVSGIQFKTQSEADAAYRQIKGGADFATLAKQAKQGTGQIGCLGAYLPKEIFDVANRVPVNLITVPVKFQNGYAILRITPWNDQYASDQQLGQTLSPAFGALIDLAEVTVNPRFGSWEGVQQQDPSTGQVQVVHEVVPPVVPAPHNGRTPATSTTVPALQPQG